ncbi:hypothetical protein [Haladaptatus halobius]|uniref:hypothetical protein n=1 Tax=Haladaptatus halobius TaxID=2884875 RepID=UPI001D0A2C3F|nr:hypothetical protein [Haladaptatus halobius]
MEHRAVSFDAEAFSETVDADTLPDAIELSAVPNAVESGEPRKAFDLTKLMEAVDFREFWSSEKMQELWNESKELSDAVGALSGEDAADEEDSDLVESTTEKTEMASEVTEGKLQSELGTTSRSSARKSTSPATGFESR